MKLSCLLLKKLLITVTKNFGIEGKCENSGIILVNINTVICKVLRSQ